MEIKYSYAPVPTIKKFSESNAFMRALMGPIGSGKSVGCVIEILKRAAQQKPGPDGIKRSRWVAIRQTYPQLRDTTIKTFMQWVPPQHFGEYKQSENLYVINAFENTHIEVLFRALDKPSDVSNLLSMELTGGWINEAKDVAWPVVEALQGRVGRYPSQREGGPTWHGVFMDTNPPDVDSKFYKYWENPDRNTELAQIFKQPSGLSKDAENKTNLVPNYYKNVAEGKDEEWVKVYVHGQYGFVIDGRPVYPEYSDPIHCKEFKPLSYENIVRGWDFGLTPACIFTQLTPSGQLLVVDEMVSDSMGVDQFSDEVLTYCSSKYPDFTFTDIGDPAGGQRAQTDEKTCFQILMSKGIMIEPGMQSTAIRLESVRRPLTRLTMGKPGFQLHPRCNMLRKGFMGGYQFRRLQTSQERYTSAPDKNQYSHPHDALQYACTHFFGGGLTTPNYREDANFRDNDGYDGAGRSDTTGY